MNSELASLPGLRAFDLTGRTALITGGSKGLGAAMAAGLASAGADVMIVSRHLDEAQSTATTIAQTWSHRAVAMAVDVTDPAQVEGMIAAGIRNLGKIDILINSAGINVRGPIEEFPVETYQQIMRTNVDGTWLACRAVVPHMKARGSGRIINLASALGLVGLQHRTPYTASKGAIVQMTRTLALELAPQGITANAICPGPFLTEINRAIANNEEAVRTVVGATAFKRWARLEEIQGAAIFLASDAASYVTGTMLAVDGGWTAH
jgi:NAD(P)-dependent dehydrogenase (short-subunit alcohol dehydrogenase family)